MDMQKIKRQHLSSYKKGAMAMNHNALMADIHIGVMLCINEFP
ncbi:hypothetical protein [Aeromonas eucrenophila]